MPLPTERNQYPFDKSGTYRIHLVGYVNESWSDRLGDMRIEEKNRGDQGSTTTLVGRIRDQAELMGVIRKYGIVAVLMSGWMARPVLMPDQMVMWLPFWMWIPLLMPLPRSAPASCMESGQVMVTSKSVIPAPSILQRYHIVMLTPSQMVMV